MVYAAGMNPHEGANAITAQYAAETRERRLGSPLALANWIRISTIALFLSGPTVVLLHADSPGSSDPPSSGPRAAGRWQDASLEDYRKHLVALETLTDACAKARNLKACDPTLVGPDDRIPLSSAAPGEHRIVRYGWLRVLLSRADEPDKAQRAPDSRARAIPEQERVRPQAPTTSRLLADAQARLAYDLAQAGTATATAEHAQEHEVLKQVLAGREFRDLKQPTERDSALERMSAWLNKFFANFNKIRTRSAWIGRALIWGFFAAIAIALAWGLMQMERRWRVRLVPLADRPAPEAASARDWQLWLADARQAAATGQWREAIHFVYWAAISRLESRRLWPADRARTPREYLALVAPDDPRRPGLASLTGSFERTWYGGRTAIESDYRTAEALAAQLISGTARAGTAPAPTEEGGGA